MQYNYTMVNSTTPRLTPANLKEDFHLNTHLNGTFLEQPEYSLWTDPDYVIPVVTFLLTGLIGLMAYLAKKCKKLETPNNDAVLQSVYFVPDSTTGTSTSVLPQVGPLPPHGQIWYCTLTHGQQQPQGLNEQKSKLFPSVLLKPERLLDNVLLKLPVKPPVQLPTEESIQETSFQNAAPVDPRSSSFDQDQADSTTYSGKFLSESPPQAQSPNENDQNMPVVDLSEEKEKPGLGFRKNFARRWKKHTEVNPSPKANPMSVELKNQLKSMYVY